MKIVAAIGLGLSAFGLASCALAPVPPISHQTYYNCPTDGTVYGYGNCVLPENVMPAPESMHVKPGAPSKVCNYNDTLFECPASYEVPSE